MPKYLACFIVLSIHETNRSIGTEKRNRIYEGWNFNSGNYLFTTDTK